MSFSNGSGFYDYQPGGILQATGTSLPLPSPSNVFGNPVEMYTYAQARTSAADNFIVQLGNLVANMVPPVIEPVFPTGDAAPTIITTLPPELQQVQWNAPAVPTSFTEGLNLGGLTIDSFDGTPPVLAFGTAPAPFSGVTPDAPGIDLQFAYPDLNLNLPAPPNLLSLTVSPFGGLNLPAQISSDVPELTIVEPTIREYVPGALYTSSLLTSLRNTLQDRIVNGGTGLPAAVENALWDRGREREYRQVADAIRSLERMETMGFALPPGGYVDARLKIETEMQKTSAGLSREIMIKQAELEQQNIIAALNTATQIESQLINYQNQTEQRLFEADRYVTQAGVEIYNAKVRAYAAFLDAYKTKVNIYEAQIRGELAKVEAYKAEIQAEQAKAEINTALVNQYRVQADVALSAIEVFKAEIQAIQAKAEIEKLKISIFGEQVRAYATTINAYTAQVEGYKASVQAEGVKQDAYRSQVQAYSAEVDATVKQIDARIEEYKAKIAAKSLEWDGYKSAADAEKSRAQAIASINQSITTAYSAEVQGVSSYNEVVLKQWQAALEQAQKTAEIGVAAAKANGDLFVATRGLALDAAKVGAQVSAQLGASALSAIQWSSSIGNQFSANSSNSTSYSVGLSQSGGLPPLPT
jgi:hypothetical protein